MGGRKFRLAPHLKNEERSKKSALVVSIKRENISVHVSSVTITPSQLETTVDPQPLTCTVSVPLQVLSDDVVETLDRLAALLQLLNPFSSWTVADHGVLVLVKQSFMWSRYHTLRLSPRYISEWQKFFGLIPDISVPKYWAMVFQYAGHFMLKEMIESKCTVTDAASYISPSLTYSEYNALRYAAGYVPCALRKKVIRSSYSQERKTDLLNCLDDMVDADVVPCDSTDWIECVNRGGLTFVNDLTFEIFVAMELEIRIHLQGPQQPVNLSSIAPAIKNNEDVLFLWSMLSAGWSESAGSTLLDMVISMWVGIRGFSYSSALVEKYKKEHKRTTQKSKGLRKQL